MIRVLLADDHTILRAGLRLLIEREPDLAVAGEAADGIEAVRLAEAVRPDIALMDVAMPLLNGIEAARRIVAGSAKTAVGMLSMHSDESYLLRSLRAGARAYLLKDSAEADVLQAIRGLAAGRTFFSPKVSAILQQDHIRQLEAEQATDSFELLTPREREILQRIGEGQANKDIANALNLSLYTVETHRAHILAKLNLHGTADLILYAVRKGIVR